MHMDRCAVSLGARVRWEIRYGVQCAECDGYDFQRGTEEEEAVQLAGRIAERESRQRQQPLPDMDNRLETGTRVKDRISTEWSLQSFLNWFMAGYLTCKWCGGTEGM